MVLWVISCICIMFIVGCFIWSSIKMAQWDKKNEESKIEVTKKIQMLNQSFLNGSWEFPAAEYYQLCYDSKVLDLNNDFALQKATLLAKQVIRQKVDNEFWKDGFCMNDERYSSLNVEKYLTKEKLEEFLVKGEGLVRADNAKKLAEQKQPRNVKANKNEELFINRSSECLHLHGRDKRKQILTNLIKDYDNKIEAMENGKKALMQLGMIYADQQKKESDWALLGGIAEGIAGSAAGFAVATNTVANNVKIREHNATMRKVSMDIMSGIPEISGNVGKLIEEKDKFVVQKIAVESKVVLVNPSKDEIWENIKVGNATVKKNQSGVLAVALPVTIKEPFVLDVPDCIGTVVDGTIKGEVWFEDKLVGDVVFPLPLYGIPTNMTAEVTLDAMCGRSVEFDGEYIVKIADEQNLWIMEA